MQALETKLAHERVAKEELSWRPNGLPGSRPIRSAMRPLLGAGRRGRLRQVMAAQ